MAEETRVYQVNGKYRIVIERAASTKGIDGFKVEANDDSLSQVELEVQALYSYVQGITAPTAKMAEEVK